MKAILVILALITLAGCRSPERLSSDGRAYLESLSEAERTHIVDGDPAVGDSLRGVTIAFGEPAFRRKVPDGMELVYYRVVSRRYPKTLEHYRDEVWEATTDLHIVVKGDRVVSVKATANYEDTHRGPARH